MGLVQRQGICKYCGQYTVVEVPEKYTVEEINEEASRKCNCEGAVAAIQIEDIQAVAEANIREMFKNNEELNEMKAIALEMVEPLSQFKLSKITLSHGNYQLKMIRKEKKISLALKYTDEDKRE